MNRVVELTKKMIYGLTVNNKLFLGSFYYVMFDKK